MYTNMRQLKVGSKYTIALFDYNGCPYHLKVDLKGLLCVNHGPWPEAYSLLYRKIDTKALCRIILHPGKQFVIWEGIQNPDTQLAVSESLKDDGNCPVRILKRWRHNDPRYMQRAKDSVLNAPLIENFKRTSANDPMVFDLCTVSGY